MKWVFVLLLLVNAALGGYLYWRHITPDPDSRLVQLQMNADQIRIIPEPPKPPPAPATQTAACLEWRAFSGADLDRVRQSLAAVGLGGRVAEREVSVLASWWVHMPPTGSQAAMQRKASELEELGITDFFPVTEAGRWRYAISLGLFRTEDAARAYLAQLRTKGVRSAVVAKREQRLTQTAFVVREPSAEESAKLAELSAASPGTELRAADCPG
jgi:hypothetical protein